MNDVKVLAYYLPQFHPIPENDKWWGKGFTEWTNVTKAKPLFKGHRQPKLPGELGFYDLRIPEIRESQALLAQDYGIDGFCYWHYWFGNGRKLMEYPINEVFKSGKPNFSYCFAWANQTWGGLPYGDGFDRILIEQVYPGRQDIIDHYNYVRRFFMDDRYVKIANKPFFQINTSDFPNVKIFIDIWNELAIKDGFSGIYFVAHDLPEFNYEILNYNALSFITPSHLFRLKSKEKLSSLLIKFDQYLRGFSPELYDYKQLINLQQIYYTSLSKSINKNYIPVAIPNWDHSPRSKNKSKIIVNSNPELFSQNLSICLDLINKTNSDGILLIKAWNEWAEGNMLEPDAEFGRGYLEACKKFKLGVKKLN